MNNQNEKSTNDLEKMIKKASRIAKDKNLSLQRREKRKLRIKEKRLIQKLNNVDIDDIL